MNSTDVFSRRETGFHRWTKCFGLKVYMYLRKTSLQMIKPGVKIILTAHNKIEFTKYY